MVLRLALLLTVAVLAVAMPLRDAAARCVNTTTGGQVTDGADAPASGQAVICDTGTPNPSTTVISAVPGSTGVSVTVQSGAILQTTLRAIGVFNSSTVLNQGRVSTVGGINAFGLSTTGAGSILINEGIVTTTGTNSHGLNAQGTNSTLTNRGSITVSGTGAHGIRSLETTAGTQLTNSGTITQLGSGGSGVLMTGGTLTNQAGGSISGQVAGVNVTSGAANVINSGTITGVSGLGLTFAGTFANMVTNSGIINGNVDLGAGDDTFTWQNAGTITGTISLGTGTDTATLRNLTNANLAGTTLADGGPGVDRLVLDNASLSSTLFTNWETVELTNGSQFTLTGPLVLGDSGTLTGTLSIDQTSTLFAGAGVNPTIRSFDGVSFVTVTNAGFIDLTNGASGTTDSLTIAGNYVGTGGRIRLNTVLGSDGSPSDRLVIDSGTASGTSSLLISNFGGAGALTTGNGILVVDTSNGGTTQAGAFMLGTPAVAGPYEYTLYRSSIDASNAQAWYLRSALDCTLDPTNLACVITPSAPADLRPETSLYAAIPSLAILYGRSLLDTLHERAGEQEHLRGRRNLGASASNNGQWGRVVVLNGNRNGDALGIYGNGPAYDYGFGAFQAGQDLYRAEQGNGARNHLGVYGAVGGGRGNVSHFDGSAAGHDSFMAYTVGGYWTHFGATGWYVDSVLQGTWYDIKGNSDRGVPTLQTGGGCLAGSLEGGYPIRLGYGWIFEPQAQAVYQLIGLPDASDTAATVKFGNVQSLAGRVGVRIANTWQADGATITAWLRPNIWHEYLGDPKTSFSSATGYIPFRADLAGSWAELNVGVSTQFGAATSVFANASYQVGLDGRSDAWDAKLGLRVNW